MNAARRRAPAVVLAVAIAGCSLTPVDVETRKALISQMPIGVAVSPPIDATLLVLPTTAAAAYDTAQMAYSSSTYELAYFARNEWAEKPARMLNGLIVRTIAATHRFRAVAVAPLASHAGYSLATELVELRQDFTVEPPAASIALHAELRDAKGHTIASRELEAREPMAQRSPRAGAVAANAAAARILRDVAGFTIENAR